MISSFRRLARTLGIVLILFYPDGKSTGNPIPGSIKHIVFKKNKEVLYAVHRQLPAPKDTKDPFRFYPHFPAKLYSSNLSADLVLVKPFLGGITLCTLEDGERYSCRTHSLKGK